MQTVPGRSRSLAAACLLGLLALNPAAHAAQPAPDWNLAHSNLVEVLVGLVRIDTSNPPGNETKAAVYLRDLLARDGIPSEILEAEAGRGSLVARLRGNGRKAPLLLLGHTDVVGVERAKWTVDPFAGVIRDGHLYGRGVVDDKAMTAACVEVFRWLARLKIPLDRDVILLAEAGEESSTQVGIDFLVREHWDKIQCEYALNEGGGIRAVDGRVHYVGVATTEKVPRPILLSAHGKSGHGSKPTLDNPVVHLAAAVAKVGQWQAPMRLNETTREFFKRLATISPPEDRFLFENLENPELAELVQRRLHQRHPGYHSMLRTSIAPTILKGGFRANVIPGDALATLDVRALPDEDIDAFAARLRELIADPSVEVVRAGGTRPATPPSRLDTELFRAIEAAQRELFPEARTLPMMLTGATDSAQLRARGVQCYGLGTWLTEDDAGRIHGNDERVEIAGLRPFLQLLWRVVNEVAAGR